MESDPSERLNPVGDLGQKKASVFTDGSDPAKGLGLVGSVGSKGNQNEEPSA